MRHEPEGCDDVHASCEAPVRERLLARGTGVPEPQNGRILQTTEKYQPYQLDVLECHGIARPEGMRGALKQCLNDAESGLRGRGDLTITKRRSSSLAFETGLVAG